MQTLDVAGLRKAGRTPSHTVAVQLPDGQQLQFERWLRILPGKRLVGMAVWKGRAVLAKLFIANRARRHWQRELDGILALQQAQLPTPQLLASGELVGGGHYLLTEFLSGSQDLQQCWDALEGDAVDNPQSLQIQQQAIEMIAQMHAGGIAQADLHLANFLRHDSQLYVIDGDAIEAQQAGQRLDENVAQGNLALFFAQFEASQDVHMEALLAEYLAINPLPSLNRQQVMQDIRRIRQQRLDAFLDKTLRDCSQFAVKQGFSRFAAVLRSEAGMLASLLAQPNAVFTGEPLLKDGGSSTVTRTCIDGQELVVKRYNVKSLTHWLRRFWRPSRAWHSWQAGWRLHFLGVATPQPLAMLERRFGPLRREAWLVTRYCPGQSVLQHLGASGTEIPDSEFAVALQQCLGQLAQARISHGDFKATNLLWHEGKVWLIDLDAMRAHENEESWHQAWCKDRARFIRNWPAGSPLAIWMEQHLPE